jgi:PAS domain S-box-containing protein
MNETYCKHFTKRKDQIIGHKIEELYGEEFFTKTIKSHLDQCFTGKNVQYQEYFTFDDIGMRYLEVYYIPYKNENGEINGAISQIIDITKSKRKVDFLEEEYKIIRNIIEHSNEVYYMIDPEGKLTYISPQSFKIGEYMPDELIGEPFTKIVPFNEFNKEAYESFYKGIQTGERQPIAIVEIVKKNGEKILCESDDHPIKNEKGEIIGIVGLLRDVTQKIKADEEIRKSEEKIRNFLESSPDSITVTDLNGTIIECNEATLKLYGASSKEEIIGSSSFILFPNREQERAMQNFKKILIEGSIKNVEYTLLKKDGTEFIAELSANIIRDGQGKPEGFVAIVKDISDRKEAEKLLQKSEQNLRKSQSIAHIGSWEWSLTTKKFIMSDKIKKIYGIKDNEEYTDINTMINTFIHPDDKELIETSKEKILQEYEGGALEYRIIRADGELRWIRAIAPESISDENNTLIYGVIQDITNQKTAEETIKDHTKELELINLINSYGTKVNSSQELIKKIIKTTLTFFNYDGGGIYLADWEKQKAILQQNHGEFKEFIETVKEIDLNQEPYSIIFKDKQPIIVDDYSEIMPDDAEKWGLKSTASIPLISNDVVIGALNIASKELKPLTKKNKQTILTIGNESGNVIAKILAEEKALKANEELKLLNKELEQKIEDRTREIKQILINKDEFVNQLGHDLKNPLHPLVNLLPLISKEEKDQKKKEIIDVLIRNVKYMKNLVTKTIVLAQLNSPNTKLNLEEINLLNEINEVINANKIMFTENYVEIINNISDDIIVNFDKLRVDELITNIMSNSVKYTIEQGIITLDAIKNDEDVTVSLKDNGIGMTEDQLLKVFDEFYKVDTTKKEFESSGLGMPICKRIVEKHGGKIWAESQGKDTGSTFYFTIPKIKNDSSEEQND